MSSDYTSIWQGVAELAEFVAIVVAPLVLIDWWDSRRLGKKKQRGFPLTPPPSAGPSDHDGKEKE